MEPQSSGRVPTRAPNRRLNPDNFLANLREQDPVAFHRLVEQSLGSEHASRVRPAPEVLRQYEQAEAERTEALAPSTSPYWNYFPSNADPIELLAKWQRIRIHGLEKRPEFNNLLGWSLELLSNGRWRVRLIDNSTVLSVGLRNLQRVHVQACDAESSTHRDVLRCLDLCRNLSFKVAALLKGKQHTTKMEASGMRVLDLLELQPTVEDERLLVCAAEVLMRMVDQLDSSSTWQIHIRLSFNLEAIEKATQRLLPQRIVSRVFRSQHTPDQSETVAFRKILQQLSTHLQDLKEEFCLAGIFEAVLGAQARSGSNQCATVLEATAQKHDDAAVVDVIQECLHPDHAAAVHATDEVIADVAWATGVEAMIRSNAGDGGEAAKVSVWQAQDEELTTEEVYLLQFSRYPKELRVALLEGIPLRQCRQMMEDEGYAVNLPSGAKVFVHPGQYQDVTTALEGMALRPYHVVVSQSLEHLVQESLQQVPRQSKVKVKARSAVQLVGCLAAIEQTLADDECEDLLSQRLYSYELDLVERRTFLCIAPQLRNSGSVVQSTTEAHGCVNPRRWVPT